MELNIFQPKSNLDDEVQTHIDRSIEQKIRGWALLGAWFLISVILGYVISTIWDLNGKIYEVAGKQEIQYDFINSLKDDVSDLEKEKKNLIEEKHKLADDAFKLKSNIHDLENQNRKLELKNQDLALKVKKPLEL